MVTGTRSWVARGVLLSLLVTAAGAADPPPSGGGPWGHDSQVAMDTEWEDRTDTEGDVLLPIGMSLGDGDGDGHGHGDKIQGDVYPEVGVPYPGSSQRGDHTFGAADPLSGGRPHPLSTPAGSSDTTRTGRRRSPKYYTAAEYRRCMHSIMGENTVESNPTPERKGNRSSRHRTEKHRMCRRMLRRAAAETPGSRDVQGDSSGGAAPEDATPTPSQPPTVTAKPSALTVEQRRAIKEAKREAFRLHKQRKAEARLRKKAKQQAASATAGDGAQGGKQPGPGDGLARDAKAGQNGGPSPGKSNAQPGGSSSSSWSGAGAGGIYQRTYMTNMGDLYSSVQQLETRLLGEMVTTREMRTSMMLQDQLISRLNHTVALRDAQYRALEAEVAEVRQWMARQREQDHSRDDKMAALMLDVAEVNHMLANQAPAPSLLQRELQSKVIPVEAASLTSACAVPPNATKYRDCEELYQRGHSRSGVYYVTPLYSPCPVPVFCDMDTPPAGWLVVQRHTAANVSFNHDWDTYRKGFGDVTQDHWLGNDNLFLLSNQRHYELRVDLWDFQGSRVFARYVHFKVGGERDRYQLHVSNHSGTAPDGLAKHDGAYFSTPDRDNDNYSEYHCAREWGAGWWYSNCWFVILNGLYHNTTDVEYRGIAWNDWKGEQLKASEMKIRPLGY